MMTEGVESLRAQVRWLSRAIAAAVVLMFAVVALPWLLRMIEADVTAMAWTLTAFAAWHALLTLAVEHARTTAVMVRLLYAVPLFGIGFMALLWHHAGGIGHPALAMAMLLPVVAAGALPRRTFAFDVAAYSIVVVMVIVTIAARDFGWYVTQLGVPGSLVAHIATDELAPPDPFPGATTTPAGAFLFVATFAAIQLAAAFTTTRIVRFARSSESFAARFVHVPEALPADAIQAIPATGVVVVAATGQIVYATKRFIQQMLLHDEHVVGRELTSLLAFDDARAVGDALADGGSLALCRYRVGTEERLAALHVNRFEHGGVGYASVVLTDRDSEGWLAAAAAVAPEPLLLIDAEGRLRYANDAARALFDELYVGREITPLLGDWWRRRDVAHERVEIAGRRFDAKATPVSLFASPAVLVTLSAGSAHS